MTIEAVCKIFLSPPLWAYKCANFRMACGARERGHRQQHTMPNSRQEYMEVPFRFKDVASQGSQSLERDRVDENYFLRGTRTKAMTPLSSSISDISPSSSSSAAVTTATGVRQAFVARLNAATERVLSPSDSASVCTTLDSASLSSVSASASMWHDCLRHKCDNSTSRHVVPS